ncbi:phosphoserine phosphatase SerB [Mariniluteicoccus flavus]
MIDVRLGLAAPAPIPDDLIDGMCVLLGDLDELPLDLPAPDAFHAAAYAARVAPERLDEVRIRVRALADFNRCSAALVAGPLATEPPGLVVMDVDSTLVTAEVIELIAERAGTRAAVAEITERAMRGELDFAASLRERVATLAGVPDTVFDDVRAELELAPGARELIAHLHARGTHVGLVSGGFAEVVRPLAATLDLEPELVEANRLEVADGRLTGRTTGPVVDRDAKARHLAAYADRVGVPLSHTVAIGDGANDLAILAAAGLGVAYCAKPITREAADAAILFPRLDAVLAFVASAP